MSLFRTTEAKCPACETPVTFDLVYSVNADRRPVLRAQMLDRSFQAKTCPTCATEFRIEPEFTYLHSGGRQFLSIWPASKLAQWDECERRSREMFDRFYGSGATPAAAAIGAELAPRTVFGFEAAREKIVANQAGIDDLTLELAKIGLMRAGGTSDLGLERELRLLGLEEDGTLAFGEFVPGDDTLLGGVTLPRAALDEIEADAEGWQALRDSLAGHMFVDLLRLVVEPQGQAEAA